MNATVKLSPSMEHVIARLATGSYLIQRQGDDSWVLEKGNITASTAKAMLSRGLIRMSQHAPLIRCDYYKLTETGKKAAETMWADDPFAQLTGVSKAKLFGND